MNKTRSISNCAIDFLVVKYSMCWTSMTVDSGKIDANYTIFRYDLLI